jgi:hypothetical protein
MDWLYCDTIQSLLGFSVVDLATPSNLLVEENDKIKVFNKDCIEQNNFKIPISTSTGNPVYFDNFNTTLKGDTMILKDMEAHKLLLTFDRGQHWTNLAFPWIGLDYFDRILLFQNRLFYGSNGLRFWESIDWGLHWNLISNGISSDKPYFYAIKNDFLIAEPFSDPIHNGWYFTKDPSINWNKVSSSPRPYVDNFEIKDSILFFSSSLALFSLDARPILNGNSVRIIEKESKNAKNKAFCTLSPNPANDLIILNFENDETWSKPLAIDIVNQLGQTVKHFEGIIPSQNTLKIGVDDIKNGVYFVKIAFGNRQNIVNKVVIAR